MSKASNNTIDILAVRIDDGTVRVLATAKTQAQADAVERMAVMRRGVELEFFAKAPTGKYKTGDLWSNEPTPPPAEAAP